jgi:hypothetical protein
MSAQRRIPTRNEVRSFGKGSSVTFGTLSRDVGRMHRGPAQRLHSRLHTRCRMCPDIPTADDYHLSPTD